MIELLRRPLIAVVDDEEADYKPILEALSALHVGCVHYKGSVIDELPAAPLRSLRLVFMDLHLDGTMGKAAASRAAKVFAQLVPPDSAPVVVVVWSKYAQEHDQTPGNAEETEADLFRSTLLGSDSRYGERLFFLEMSKPKSGDRPALAEWIEVLKKQIAGLGSDLDALHFLWGWEGAVAAAVDAVNEELTGIAAYAAVGGVPLATGLAGVLQSVAHAQGEGDLSSDTGSLHAVQLLGDVLGDQILHGKSTDALKPHGKWLAQPPSVAPGKLAPRVNSFLLTASCNTLSPFMPGTVYAVTDETQLEMVTGFKAGTVLYECCTPSFQRTEDEKGDRKKAQEIRALWRQGAKPILLEISPDCDVAQRKRHVATLVAGVILPASHRDHIKSGDSFQSIPVFELRWPTVGFGSQDVVLAFCSRFKMTTSAKTVPGWMTPWFRLRQMPTASLRNWFAGNSARIGYVYLR